MKHSCAPYSTNLGGSSCVVKITPNAPNLDHAKKTFFTASVFWKQNISPKKVSFLPFVPICAFFQTGQNKKKIKKKKKSYDFNGK